MVHTQHKIGLFGKLPHYGDFLTRDLSSNCIEVWDNWLQGYISGAQEQLGDNWLDVYLTSPIWRFVLSPGVIDNHTWLGIMLPSVDRVGRYFPFSVLVPITTSLPAVYIHQQAEPWFTSVEHAVLDALDHSTPIENLSEQLNQINLLEHIPYQLSHHPASRTGTVISSAMSSPDSSTYALMLGNVMQTQHSSYSVWSTQGSDYVEPCLMISPAMPAVSAIAAMLDGDWPQSLWHMPYYFTGEHTQQQDEQALSAQPGSAAQPRLTEQQATASLAYSSSRTDDAFLAPSAPQASGALSAFDDQIEKIKQSSPEPISSPEPVDSAHMQYNSDITQPWPLNDDTDPNASASVSGFGRQITDPQSVDPENINPFDQQHDIPDDHADPFDHLGVFELPDAAQANNGSTAAKKPHDGLNLSDDNLDAAFDISGIDAAQIDVDNLDPFESELAKYQTPTKKEPK